MNANPPASPGLPPNYEIIDHTADWALRIYGGDMTQLLINAAKGMRSLLLEHDQDIRTNVDRQLTLDSLDAESLLVDWLTELAYWAESELLIFTKISVNNVSETHLDAAMVGGHVPRLARHIKAVTYHDLEITRTSRGLMTTVVFDV